MIGLRPRLSQAGAGLLALALLALLPRGAAAGITFQNDLKVPVLVQGASLVNRMVRRGPPLVILPGRSVQDAQVPVGARHISIYDASMPNRILYRDHILYQGQDLYYRIHRGPGGTIQLVPFDPQQGP